MRLRLGGDLGRRAVGHEARDGQVRPARSRAPSFQTVTPPPTSAQPVRGGGHAGAAVPTTIMWWLSWATVEAMAMRPVVAEARDEAVHDLARGPVAFDERDLADARPRLRRAPLDDGKLGGRARLVGAWFSTTPMTWARDGVGARRARGRRSRRRRGLVPCGRSRARPRASRSAGSRRSSRRHGDGHAPRDDAVDRQRA